MPFSSAGDPNDGGTVGTAKTVERLSFHGDPPSRRPDHVGGSHPTGWVGFFVLSFRATDASLPSRETLAPHV